MAAAAAAAGGAAGGGDTRFTSLDTMCKPGPGDIRQTRLFINGAFVEGVHKKQCVARRARWPAVPPLGNTIMRHSLPFPAALRLQVSGARPRHG